MVLLGDLGEVFGFRAVQLHVLASRVPKHLHQVSTSGLNLKGWIGLRDPVARDRMILCAHDRIHRKYSAHLQSHNCIRIPVERGAQVQSQLLQP